jgi:hypothetical protein
MGGKVRVPSTFKTYDLIVRVVDIFGNIHESVVSEVSALKPITIVDGHTNRPLPEVTVLLKKFNPITQLYETVTSLGPDNEHLLSDRDGRVSFTPNPGKYLATISKTGYESKEIEFEFWSENQNTLPDIHLHPTMDTYFLTFVGAGLLMGIVLSVSFWLVWLWFVKKKRRNENRSKSKLVFQ